VAVVRHLIISRHLVVQVVEVRQAAHIALALLELLIKAMLAALPLLMILMVALAVEVRVRLVAQIALQQVALAVRVFHQVLQGHL
jgi:hypothetical protein